jgi:hypothetical protein
VALLHLPVASSAVPKATHVILGDLGLQLPNGQSLVVIPAPQTHLVELRVQALQTHMLALRIFRRLNLMSTVPAEIVHPRWVLLSGAGWIPRLILVPLLFDERPAD